MKEKAQDKEVQIMLPKEAPNSKKEYQSLQQTASLQQIATILSGKLR